MRRFIAPALASATLFALIAYCTRTPEPAPPLQACFQGTTQVPCGTEPEVTQPVGEAVPLPQLLRVPPIHGETDRPLPLDEFLHEREVREAQEKRSHKVAFIAGQLVPFRTRSNLTPPLFDIAAVRAMIPDQPEVARSVLEASFNRDGSVMTLAALGALLGLPEYAIAYHHIMLAVYGSDTRHAQGREESLAALADLENRIDEYEFRAASQQAVAIVSSPQCCSF